MSRKKRMIKDVTLFDFTYMYVDDVLSIFDRVLLIYTSVIDITEITYTTSSASFVDIYQWFSQYQNL